MGLPKNVVIPDPPGYATSSKISKKGKKLGPNGGSDALALAPANDRALEVGKAVQANQLKIKKAWELALSPAKSLPMQAIMLYMSGSGVQMFSMGIVWTLLTGPWVAVAGLFRAFEPFKQKPLNSIPATSSAVQSQASEPERPRYTTELAAPMLVYVLCQCAVLALGIYKCSTMGLVPAGSGDWLQFETREEIGAQ